MERIISCCGVVCSACPYYPADCQGCPAIRGRVFWLAYTGEAVCGIYQCCVEDRGLPHCGRCPELPCGRYDAADPTKTPEENAQDFASQMAQLRSMDAPPRRDP